MPLRTCALVSLLCLCPIAAAAIVRDSSLKVQNWVSSGLNNPTGMAFIDNGNAALVLEKNSGQVKIVANRGVAGVAADLAVANNSERGLLGIALSPTFATDNFVYLSYTRAAGDGGPAIDNCVDRFRWTGSKLQFERRVIAMPATPGPNHNGGKIAFGPDQKLYAVVGDLNRDESTLNYERAKRITRSGAILRVNPSGSTPTNNPFYDAKFVGTQYEAINDIYAYGIRNSYGIAFDPVSGFLWDTENGPNRMDEINRVDRGFNSGWADVMGPVARNPGGAGKLVSLGANARYGDPRLSWEEPVAPTDAFFMDTARLGARYRHDFFVGTVLADGVIYRFDMSPSRKTLGLSGPLADGVADNSEAFLLEEQDSIVWGEGFGVVTDILSGPGGMYVLSLSNNAMYRITTTAAAAAPTGALASVTAVPEPSSLAAGVLAASTLLRRRRKLSV